MNTDTPEGFLDEEERHVLGIAEHFNGKKLAPYSEGVRLLWINTWQNTIARFAACGLIWLMIRLREEYDKLGHVVDLDTRWMMASAAMIEEAENRAITKARVMQWAASIGEDQTLEALKLANRIMEGANESDAKEQADASAGEAEEPGNAAASRLPLQAT